jgi:hypothetical protein
LAARGGTHFDAGERRGRGRLASGGITGQIVDPVRWELGGALSGFTQTGATTTRSGEVNARLRFGGPWGGVALGGGTGASANSFYNVAVGRGSFDAWWSSGQERLLASAMLTHIGSTSYTDIAAGWRHEAGGASIGATAALRSAPETAAGEAADAELWLFSRLAIVVAAGTRFRRGAGHAEHTVRVGEFARGVATARALRFGREANAGVRVVITRSSGGRRNGAHRRLGAQGGARELMADFTGWEPIVSSARATAGSWTAR